MTPRCSATLSPVLLVVGLLAGCGGGEEGAPEPRSPAERYRGGCVTRCLHRYDRQLCRDYCACSAGFLEARGLFEALPRIDPLRGSTAEASLELMDACGEELFDAQYRQVFVTSCLAEMPSEEDRFRSLCEGLAACMIRELRGVGEDARDTGWILRNVEAEPPTQEGRARLAAAEEICARE